MVGSAGNVKAGAAGTSEQAKEATKSIYKGAVLHGRANPPISPVKFAAGGFAIVFTIAYFTLFSHKKSEATALDVAKVASNVATPENTHPRN